MPNRSIVWSALCIATSLGAGGMGCGSSESGTEAFTAPTSTPTGAGAAGQASAAPTTNPGAVAPATTSTAATPAATGGTSTGASPAAAASTAVPGAMAVSAGAATPAATTTAGAMTDPAAAATTMATDPSVKLGPTGYPDLRGTCGINSGYPGDETCLPAPPPGEGMQIHVGPSNYEDAAEVARYLMHPGEESSECWTFHTPNTEDVYYQTYELSGRGGTHHIINTMYNTELADGGFTVCADPGTGTNGNIIDNLPGASKAYMPRGTIAPENMGLGRKIPPNAASQADMHYYNFTDKDIIREFWMNIYFVDKSLVTEQADQIRGMGGISWQGPLGIAPGTKETYKYECPVTGDGRILSLLGHYHAHGQHFTASIRRAGSGMVEKVFEMYDFQDPATFEYNTVVQNPGFSASAAGALSGLLEIHNGDVLMWDCYIVNDSNVALTYTNEVKTGEMCNLWGSSVGIDPFNCVLP